MLQKVPATPVSKEAKELVRATKDIHNIFSKLKTSYCVIGSMAIVGTTGKFHRIPGDIDVLYDFVKRSSLEKELIKLGYKRKLQNDFKGIFKYSLEQYIKGRQIIEPRPVWFTHSGIETYFRLPLPFLPKFFWPWAKLCFKKTMSEPKLYSVGSVEFFGLRKEACFVALDTFMNLLESFDDKVEKRQKDLFVLSKGLNQSILRKIEEEKPGIYLGNFPLAVGKNPLLLKIYSRLKNLKSLLNPWSN